VEAAVEVSRLLWSVKAAVEAFEAAVEVSRLLLRYEAAVEVSRPLSKC
jgi:hypothetical protein